MKATVEISIGLVLLIFVGVMYYESFNPLYEGFGDSEFPTMRFPRFLLWGVGILTVLHLVRVAMSLVITEALFTQTLWVRAALVALAALVGALLIEPLGFTFASVLTFWVTGALLGYRNYLLLTVFAIGFGLGSWLMFTYLINIGLPTSPFFHKI